MRKKCLPLFFILVFMSVSICSFSSEVITSDMNSDGKPDGWTYIKSGNVEKQEIDLNFDGKVDGVYLYENNGKVKEEILDTNHDGKMDNWRLFDNGELIIDKVDSDFDGRIDIRIYIREGKILRIDKDTTGDGKTDKVIEY